ncbi:MAG: polysaccharide biosynthesis protein [Thermoleophilia bacterium]
MEQGLRMVKAAVVIMLLLLLAGRVTMPSSFTHVLAMVPIGGLIAFILMAGVRYYPRVFYERSLREVERRLSLLVVGAGSAGEMIIRSIQRDSATGLEAVALVDDKRELQEMEIHGVPILGTSDSIPQIVKDLQIDEIVIAIPSATLEQFRRIVKICQGTGKAVKTLRPLQSIHQGKVGLDNISDIKIEDVLGRQPVQTDYSQIRSFIKDQTVLVSGAGGSIGSELVNQISRHNPARIILVDQDESSLYRIHKQLLQRFFNAHMLWVADIKSEEKMAAIFDRFRPSLVFHAAAYKHVPLMELHADEAVLNNVRGTLIMARLAGEYGAGCFINISTDKAVEPVNVMGATKNLGERVVEELGLLFPQTRYCSVRFGNVLGSRGSVLPIFREQIRGGGPVTVTHAEMTRYFMLISEAVDLVLQAAAFDDGNAIYVLDMGKPVRIMDLAAQMIDLMRVPGSGEVEISFTGLRPGEKLNEKLTATDEEYEVFRHPKIFRVRRSASADAHLLPALDSLFELAEGGNCEVLKGSLQQLIPSYVPFDMKLVGSTGSDEGMLLAVFEEAD